MKPAYLIFALLISFASRGQKTIQAVIADSTTRQPLPFATVSSVEENNSIISSLDGSFRFPVSANTQNILISYIGHTSRVIDIKRLNKGDTIFLLPSESILGEVVIGPPTEKIRYIINTAIDNKPGHNPEQYEYYKCHIYYKVRVDMNANKDSAAKRSTAPLTAKQKKQEAELDSIRKVFKGDKHLLFSETYSKRLYKKPQQLKEIILASRFAGLKETYFANVVTSMLPFHIYGEYINLNGHDYINPVARGWQQRYSFRLVDEIASGNDTVYVLSFKPKKGKSFNALKGAVYINNNGYAISHIIASNADTTAQRKVKFEQIYTYVKGKWFPQQLNYDLQFPVSAKVLVKMNGRSRIDSVDYQETPEHKFDKAYPVIFHDSIDKRTLLDWRNFRDDTLTQAELNTYVFMDSLSEANHLETVIRAGSQIAQGWLPVGSLNVDLTRIIARNKYEKYRFGLGLYTNDKVSKYFSAGGWFGYGINDDRWKYGGSFRFHPGGKKDRYLQFAFQDNYRNPGEVRLHPFIDKSGLRNWLLQEADQFREVAVTGSIRKHYLEIRPELRVQNVRPLDTNRFTPGGKPFTAFDNYEAGIAFRFAYGERRIPVFDYYTPTETKYPIIYLRFNTGRILSGVYKSEYIRALGAVTYNLHLNRWGKDRFKLEAGIIKSKNDEALPKSFLLAGNGFDSPGTYYYASGGFVTMGPYDYYSDRYASFFYEHDLDGYLWKLKFSKPFISLAHNLIYGSTSEASRLANPVAGSLTKGYHESGLMLNQLLRYDIRFAEIFLHAGMYYHWKANSNDWKEIKPVAGVSLGF